MYKLNRMMSTNRAGGFLAWDELPSTYILHCFVRNSGLEKISPRQVGRVVNRTRRRSSLLTTPTTIDASSLFTAHPSAVTILLRNFDLL